MTSPLQEPDTVPARSALVDDRTAEVTRQALVVHQNRFQRGSRSPVYDECTQHLIAVLAKEVVYLSSLFRRPEIKVAVTVHKAITAVEAAILELIDNNRFASED